MDHELVCFDASPVPPAVFNRIKSGLMERQPSLGHSKHSSTTWVIAVRIASFVINGGGRGSVLFF